MPQCPHPALPSWAFSQVKLPSASSLSPHSPLSVDLERYYQTENEDENPFICSQPRENGMRSCRSVPTLRGEGGGGPPCGLDYEAYNSSSNTTCVNWNQYYTNCSPGEHNPFKGAINFDNIGYAWIAIFQVGQPGPETVPRTQAPGHSPGSEWPFSGWGWGQGLWRRLQEALGGPESACPSAPPQVITLEGWVDIMYFVMDAHSFYNFIYFILLIIVSDSSGPEGMGDPGEMGWGSPERGQLQSEVLAVRTMPIER